MAVKMKRKSLSNASETILSTNNVDTLDAEPVSKKAKVFNAREFIQSLRGSNATEALKEWLYLISNEREQGLLDKDSNTTPEAKQSKTGSDEGTDDNDEKKRTQNGSSEAQNEAEKEDDEFVSEDQDRNDQEKDESIEIIDSFLNAGGSPSDIAYTLPLPENAKPFQIKTVFKALTKVLLRISAEHADQIPKAIEVSRDLLNTFTKYIHDMLNIEQFVREKAIILQLLTAMVSLDEAFAKEIIGSISLEKNVVDNLTSMRMSHSVRVDYLKFLTALLIEADNSLICAILQKPWLLSSIWDGLQYDPSYLVVLLLVTIKKTILENRCVQKTTKQVIFSADGIISLLHLFKWKGPQNRPKPTSFFAMKKMSKKPKLTAEVDSNEADLVASSIQELFLVLLTDYRYGVIFRDTKVSHKIDRNQRERQDTNRNNRLVSRVLERIGHPWENAKVAALISKILAACPDSLPSTLASIEPFMVPRSSPKWFNCVNFIKQVVADQCPQDILQRQLTGMVMTELATTAMQMCIPVSVLRALSMNNTAALYNEDIAVAKCTIDLLLCMLKKVHGFIVVIRKWAFQGILSYAQSTACSGIITGKLFQKFLNLPSISTIQKAWEVWSEKCLVGNNTEASDQVAEKPIHILSLLIDLLEMYRRLNPLALDSLHSGQSQLRTSMIDFALKATDSEDTALLRNRVYHLLLDINDEGFRIENGGMQESVRLIFVDLLSSCESVRSLAWSVLKSLIKQVGCLEGSPQEAVVWLSIFQETFSGKRESCEEIVSILVESMTRACKLCPKYLDLIALSEEGATEVTNEASASSLALLDEEDLQGLYKDTLETSNAQQCDSFNSHLNASTLGPWLPAFLEVLQEYVDEKKLKRKSRQAAEEFCCKLLLRLLFRLPYPGSFLHLALNTYSNVIPPKLSDYLQSWLPGCTPHEITPNLLGDESPVGNLSSFLLNDEKIPSPENIQKLFVDLAIQALKDDSMEDTSDFEKSEAIVQVIQVVYLVCFHLTQLAQSQKLTEGGLQKSQEILLSVADVATHFDKHNKIENKHSLFYECFKVILSHPLLYQIFNPLAKRSTESSALVTSLVIILVKTASTCEDLNNYIKPYENKLLTALKTASKKKRLPKVDLASMLDAFPLKFNEVSDLLVLISNLPLSHVIVGSGAKLSQWCLLAASLLSRASNLRKKGSSSMCDVMILPSSVISQVSSWIVDVLPNTSCNITSLIEAFTSYIISCPQQTTYVPEALVPGLLRAKKGGMLAEWLSSCISQKEVLRALKGVVPKQESGNSKRQQSLMVILPVLRAVIKKRKEKEEFKKSLLMPIYELIKSEVQEAVVNTNNHPEWLILYVDVVVFLMKLYMAADDRENLCTALEKIAPALTQEKLYYLQLVEEVLQQRPPQHLVLLLAWLASSLKKHGVSSDQVTLVKILCDAIMKVLNQKFDYNVSSVKNSKVWQETLRVALKFGLSSTKQHEEGVKRGQLDMSCLLLQTLALLLKKLYSPEEDHEHIPMVHSMIIQHSEFINIMMSSSPSKLELLKVLYILLEHSPTVMESSHVPLLLAAYNASLSSTDRALLRILMLYEQRKVDSSRYRPYFWGRQGADHYSVWTQGSQSTMSLVKQPRPDQVFGLLNINMVMDSIAKFSIHSTSNIAEKESWQVDGVYDPSFYLPLFIYLLSPESPVNPFLFVRSGALALTLISLSSNDIAIRASAYTVLSRYISHLQMSWGRSKDLLLHFMSALQQGISAYGDQNPRLPSVVSVFLSRCTLEISDPLSPLYTSLMDFILSKPAIDLQTVPQFFHFLHSSHVEHLAHRQWILQVLSNGLKAPIDFVMCSEVVAFKLLPSFFSSCLSDSESQVHIVRCLQSAAGIQYGACSLVRGYALTSWLHHTIVKLDAENSLLITDMVRLVSILWNSLSVPPGGKKDPETGHSIPSIKNPASKVLYLLLALRTKLTASMDLDVLDQYISCLSDVTTNLPQGEACKITKETIESLIELSSSYCPDKREFCDLLDLGCNFLVLSGIPSQDANMKEDKLRLNLRKLIVRWIQSSVTTAKDATV